MNPDLASWLALTEEDALEPDLPVCDPHHHLWDAQAGRAEPRYLLDDFLRDLEGGHNVVSTVFVECGAMYRVDGPEPLQPVGETEFANGVAAMARSGLYGSTRVAAAIVGTAALDLGDDVARVLDAQVAAGGGRLRGIRHVLACHPGQEVPVARTRPPPGLMASDAFRAGFRHLASRGLAFDLWCYHTQLSEALDLVRAFPEQIVVLDHLGGPLGVGEFAGRADETFADWRRTFTLLAQCPNLRVKLGGLAMEVNGFGWHLRPRPPGSRELMEAMRPWVEPAIELLGVERCRFESNFPVDKVSCSYTVIWNAFKILASGCSDGEKAALFHDTAARVYRLDP